VLRMAAGGVIVGSVVTLGDTVKRLRAAHAGTALSAGTGSPMPRSS
jgi:hypothetical protein